MSADLKALRAAAVAAIEIFRGAREAAQAAADAYIQAREEVKVGDEVEVFRGSRRYVVDGVRAREVGPARWGFAEMEPSAAFSGRRILKGGALGQAENLWRLQEPSGFRVVGRYAPPEPKP